MALGDPYATLAEIKAHLSMQEDVRFDAPLQDAIESVSEEIESYCNRQFNKQTGATAREYDASNASYIYVDDFWTTSSLVIESGASFGTVWASTDYDLLPKNGTVDGQTGWPYRKIKVSRAGRYKFDSFPVRVTAQWGWAAVPAPVKQACKIMAGATFQIKDAPFGVAGSDQWGSIRVRDNQMAQTKLNRYVISRILVA
jgi:hypothetical protein